MARKLKRKKKRESDKQVIKTGNFISLLRKAYLDGAIEECILEINKGVGSITAVDMTNSMIVILSDKITSKKISGEYGLGNIDLLIKFLATVEDTDTPFKITKNKLVLWRKDSQRKLNYILTQTDLITTIFKQEDDEDPYDKISSLMKYKVDISESLKKDFLKYIGMLKTKEVVIKYNEGEVYFLCGTSEDYQIELKPDTDVEFINKKDKKKKSKDNSFSIKIDGEYLSKILSAIEYDEDNLPTMSFAEDNPIMIEENGNAWALILLTDVEEDNEEDDEE